MRVNESQFYLSREPGLYYSISKLIYFKSKHPSCNFKSNQKDSR